MGGGEHGKCACFGFNIQFDEFEIRHWQSENKA